MGLSSVGDLKQQIAHIDSSEVPAKSVNLARVSQDISSKEDIPVEKEILTKEQIDSSVRKMNDYVQSIERNLNFLVDEETGHDIVRVVDSSTDELIRQFPSEEFLKISKNLSDLAGLLFKGRA